MEKKKILEILENLKNQRKERKFDESVDLIINLKNFDIKKNSVNLFLTLPYKIKNKKSCAFLEKKSQVIDSITKQEFDQYKEKKKIKSLVKKYDFFISTAGLMPSVATSFGKYLGPSGKMPSPQFGVLKSGDDGEITGLAEQIDKVTKVKSKEPSLKFSVGKASMKNEEIAENIIYSYNSILNALPRKKENIKNTMIKLTMSKAIKIGV